MIYRVKKNMTSSLQPGHGSTFWFSETLYCGTDSTEARIAYHAAEPECVFGGYGSPCSEVEFQVLDDTDLEADEVGKFQAGDIGATR